MATVHLARDAKHGPAVARLAEEWFDVLPKSFSRRTSVLASPTAMH